jgi:hypothetical protein
MCCRSQVLDSPSTHWFRSSHSRRQCAAALDSGRLVANNQQMTDESLQSLDGQLRFAIAHKRLIEIGYNGRTRTVEPHDYGRMKGGERLLVYQRTPVTSWKLLTVPKIENCEVLEQTFRGSRGRSTQRHMEWLEVFARVE